MNRLTASKLDAVSRLARESRGADRATIERAQIDLQLLYDASPRVAVDVAEQAFQPADVRSVRSLLARPIDALARVAAATPQTTEATDTMGAQHPMAIIASYLCNGEDPAHVVAESVLMTPDGGLVLLMLRAPSDAHAYPWRVEIVDGIAAADECACWLCDGTGWIHETRCHCAAGASDEAEREDARRERVEHRHARSA